MGHQSLPHFKDTGVSEDDSQGSIFSVEATVFLFGADQYLLAANESVLNALAAGRRELLD
jgi:hypothetical protein